MLVQRLAKLLDSQFVIPGTKIRFGLDPIFSLFPVLGDLVTYLISGALIYTMHNQGASRKVVIKMILNSTFDAVVGTIPVVGTVFDIFYRSNDRNVKLLKEHYFEGKHQGSGNGILILVVIVTVLIVAAAFYGMYKLFEAIF
jgi:heme/copper-type cytochrome/quinol oxidase subunit 2